MGRILSSAVAFGACVATLTVQADDAYLFGDWGGAREGWSARGFDIEAVVSTDVLGVVDGGVDEGFEAPSNFDLVFSLDTATAGWWANGTFNLYLLGNIGGDPSLRVGDMQVSSSLETSDTFKIYEAWYEHRFLDDSLAVLVGLHDMNADFYVSEHAGLFLNSSFGIGPDTSQTGPSIFSTTSLAARVRWQTSERVYIQAAIYDGVPGDPNDPYGTQVHLRDGDGIYTIGEIGFHSAEGRYFKLALGGWYSTAEFEDFNAHLVNDNSGLYMLGEIDVIRDSESGRGVGVFSQLGFADGDRNQVGTYVGGGINWTGPLAQRPTDVAGFAVAHARNSDDFRTLNPDLARAETALELTYLVTPLPWLSFQPDVQYVIDPSTDESIENAVVVGFRLQIAL